MKTENISRFRTLDLLYCAFFAVLMAVCAWISIPGPVPFTLQTFGVFAALATLGGKRGTAAILVYLALGAIGLPVFSNFSGGLGQLVGVTGGYLAGFLLTGLIYWLVTAVLGKKLWVEAVALLLGLIAVYAFGTVWYMAAYARTTGPVGLATALLRCVVPFILPELIKLAVAFVLSVRMRKMLK